MSSFEITSYNTESGIPPDTAQQVSRLFAFNYPSSHSANDKENDVIGMLNGDAVINTMAKGSTFYVALSGADVAGFVESRVIDRQGGTYEQLTWIMTAAEYRGHRLASLLHKSFIVDATLRALERAPRPTLALLSVHEQNPAKAVYEHWGYSAIEKTDTDKLLMTMKLPTES